MNSSLERSRRGRSIGRKSLLVAVLILIGVAAASAQWGRGRYREGSFAARYPPDRMPDGDFTVCRLEYTRVKIEDMGVGWQTDYPFSERNLMTRLSELTKTPISRDERNEPNTWVVRATDPQLFNCPYVVASDAGTIGFKPEEVLQPARLPAEGRISLGRRFLGDGSLGAVVGRDRAGASADRISHQRRPA